MEKGADAFLALVRDRLEALRPRAIAALGGLPQTGYPADMTLYLEIEVGGLADAFPVNLTVDAGPGAARDWYDLQDTFAGFPALLTRAEIDSFTVFEDGPHGPQEALEQPVLDGAEVESRAILPWVIAIWAEAGLTDLPVEAVAGLHDSRDWAPLTRTKAALPGQTGKVAQPRKVPEHPLKLGPKAARYGALAFAIGALFFIWPVYGGYKDAQTVLAQEPARCGMAMPADSEAALRARVRDYFIEICQEQK